MADSSNRPNVERLPVRRDPAEVTVIQGRGSAGQALGSALVAIAPDVLRLVEQGLSARREQRAANVVDIAPVQPHGAQSRTGMQLSEVIYEIGLPFLRKVTVRNANEWSEGQTQIQQITVLPPTETNNARTLKVASVASLGGALVVTALGLLASRGGSLRNVRLRR